MDSELFELIVEKFSKKFDVDSVYAISSGYEGSNKAYSVIYLPKMKHIALNDFPLDFTIKNSERKVIVNFYSIQQIISCLQKMNKSILELTKYDSDENIILCKNDYIRYLFKNIDKFTTNYDEDYIKEFIVQCYLWR